MIDVRGDVSQPPHCTTPSSEGKYKQTINSFKSNENIHKKEDGPYYVVSANKTSTMTL